MSEVAVVNFFTVLRAFIVGGFLLILPLALGMADFTSACRGGPPVFCVRIAGMTDGGTSISLGWGYVLTYWHRNVDVVDDEGCWTRVGYKVGPRITFWFLLGREHTWFEQDEPPVRRSPSSPSDISRKKRSSVS